MNRSIFLVIAVSLVILAALFSPSLFQPRLSTNLTVTNASIMLEYQYYCQSSSGCTAVPKATLYAEIFVSSNSPLSCLDVHLNGAMEGQNCFDLTHTVQETFCSVPGAMCTNSPVNTNNTKTIRSFPLRLPLFNGSFNTPIIRVGMSYQLEVVAHFQDGASAEALELIFARSDATTTSATASG